MIKGYLGTALGRELSKEEKKVAVIIPYFPPRNVETK